MFCGGKWREIWWLVVWTPDLRLVTVVDVLQDAEDKDVEIWGDHGRVVAANAIKKAEKNPGKVGRQRRGQRMTVWLTLTKEG